MAVSGFRLRARLGFSIPSSHFGQRGITPAFGYGAPHLSAGGTSTLPIWALPSAHYGSPDVAKRAIEQVEEAESELENLIQHLGLKLEKGNVGSP